MAARRLWKPLEANPDVLERYVRELGGPDDIEFFDVLSTEEWAIQMLPTTIDALLLVYPITPQSAAHQEKRDEKHEQQLSKEDSAIKQILSDVWFTKQTIENACGTVALLHILGNINRNRLQDCSLLKFFQETTAMPPGQRGAQLEQSLTIEQAHARAEQEGASHVPTDEAALKVNEHFVAFLDRGKYILELDGRKKTPLIHQKPLTHFSNNFLHFVLPLVKQEYLDPDPQQLRFSMIAVQTSPPVKAQQE